jgi:hypothetical protein
MTHEQKESCDTCQFWEAFATRKIGNCRRHAPARGHMKGGWLGDNAQWPVTKRSDWCGEYRPVNGEDAQ